MIKTAMISINVKPPLFFILFFMIILPLFFVPVKKTGF